MKGLNLRLFQALSLVAVLCGLTVFSSGKASLTQVAEGAAADFFDPQRLSYEPDFYQPQIDAFLKQQPGVLKGTTFPFADHTETLADVLVSQGALYSLNPKIVLALLEQQSQLLSDPNPSPETLALALNLKGKNQSSLGLLRQLRLGVIELRHGLRDYADAVADGRPLPDLVFQDDAKQPPPEGMSLGRYTLARMLAKTITDTTQLPRKLATFQQVYTKLFGDPRQSPQGWPKPAEPFLIRPMTKAAMVTSFFDHDNPLLSQNGSLLSYWGQKTNTLYYDGHSGWDYALKAPDLVLAAAGGKVVFADYSNDGCATYAQAVILEHGNGYRTFYWHLSEIRVQAGEQVQPGTILGVAGESGCAIGPHLHFQVQYLGRDVDPFGWCGAKEDAWEHNPAGQISVWLWANVPSPCGEPTGGTVIVDDGSEGFVKRGEWQQSPIGYGNGALYTASVASEVNRPPWVVCSLGLPPIVVWKPSLPNAGSYRVLAYIPYYLNGLEDSPDMHYQIHHQEGETEVVVDATVNANSWADLGTYNFNPAQIPFVSLSGATAQAGSGVWADAVAWIPSR